MLLLLFTIELIVMIVCKQQQQQACRKSSAFLLKQKRNDVIKSRMGLWDCDCHNLRKNTILVNFHERIYKTDLVRKKGLLANFAVVRQ